MLEGFRISRAFQRIVEAAGRRTSCEVFPTIKAKERVQLLLLKGKGNGAIVPIREACPDCASRSSSKHNFMWERRSLKIPFLAWARSESFSFVVMDWILQERQALISRSAIKLTWRKQLGLPKGQDINSFFFPVEKKGKKA